jgi:hypothetical protein
MVLSNEPEMNVSSTGDMERDVTLKTKTNKKTSRMSSGINSTMYFPAGIYPPRPF